MNSDEMVRVVNSKPRMYVLPATKNYPAGRLIPGGNNLPLGYLSELNELPGRPGDIWRAMEETGAIRLDLSKHAASKPEGPEAPKTLGGMKAQAAMAMIDSETRAEILTAWAKAEKRKPISMAIATRLASMGVANASILRKSAETDETEED
jgi:hypothetical protein